MKKLIRLLPLAVVLAVGVAVPPLQADFSILLYPLARAFGTPSESELAKCRTAFARFKEGIGRASLEILPVWNPAHLDRFSDQDWRADLTAVVSRELGPVAGAVQVASRPPAVAPLPLGHNQLRFQWKRAAAYSQWRHDWPATGGYTCCIDLVGPPGQVIAVQVYILEAGGQVAYRRLYNSHQFGRPFLSCEEAIEMIGRNLRKDLRKEPIDLFPKWGVG